VTKERKILDVNVLAIFLVEDHPGNNYVAPIIEQGLRGAYVPLILDILPIRAYWIMTNKWGCPKEESVKAIMYFLKEYSMPEYFSLKKETIERSFLLSKKLKHDVFDCIYIAAAQQEKASAIITTDTDFEKLCKQTGIKYINPVPARILKQFAGWNMNA
jgi:predicted nucleic acid-binding protein